MKKIKIEIEIKKVHMLTRMSYEIGVEFNYNIFVKVIMR